MSIFNKVSFKRPRRSPHDLSYSSKLGLDFGSLTPMLMEKVVPSDVFKSRDEFLVRFAPFYGQVFQAFKLRTEYFYVPSRILWDGFESFLSNGLDGRTERIHPYVDLQVIWSLFSSTNTSPLNTVFDFFNFPTDIPDLEKIKDEDFKVDALPFYAICKAYLDYYVDENLDYLPLIQLFDDTTLTYAIDGDNTYRLSWLFAILQPNVLGGLYTLNQFKVHYADNNDMPDMSGYDIFRPFVRSYPKDYFTSALPFAQRGPVVQIPLNGSGDVQVILPNGYGNPDYYAYEGVGMRYKRSGNLDDPSVEVDLYPINELGVSSAATNAADITTGTSASTRNITARTSQTQPEEIANQIVRADQNHLRIKAVDINGTATITDLRTAMTVQAWLEKKARGGARAKEQIYSSFGVKSKDYRLQRTEFISAFSSTVKIGEVFTTTQDDTGDFVPGLGVSVGQLADGSKKWRKYFVEHGYCFGFISLYPSASYFQGIPRQFLELDNMDYYWPEFQHLGEQQIYNCELMIRNGVGNFDTFGYTPRYAQYKTRPNQIHGDFRSSLDYMTCARRFSQAPNLNSKFIHIDPTGNDLYRVFNATGEWAEANPAYVDIYHHLKTLRPMDYFGNPRII